MESSAFRPSPDASCTPGRMFVCQMGEEIRAKTNIFHHHFVEEQKVWSFFTLDTLLKTNIAPENGWLTTFILGKKAYFEEQKSEFSGGHGEKFKPNSLPTLILWSMGAWQRLGRGHGKDMASSCIPSIMLDIVVHSVLDAITLYIYIYTYRLPKASNFLGW